MYRRPTYHVSLLRFGGEMVESHALESRWQALELFRGVRGDTKYAAIGIFRERRKTGRSRMACLCHVKPFAHQFPSVANNRRARDTDRQRGLEYRVYGP